MQLLGHARAKAKSQITGSQNALNAYCNITSKLI